MVGKIIIQIIVVLLCIGCSEIKFAEDQNNKANSAGGECVDGVCFVGFDLISPDEFLGSVPSPNANSGKPFDISYVVPPTTGKADIMFFVDPSGSMKEEMLSIGEKFSSFIDSVAGLDWRVAISSTDMSPNGGAGHAGGLIEMKNTNPGIFYLTPAVPNFREAFRATISLPKSQTSGDDDERGIYNANLALDRRAEFGFFRQDAHLHFIFVSDEDEKSNGKDLEEFDKPQVLIDRVSQILNPPKFTAHSIITRPNDEVCLDANGSRYGLVYAELSNLTRGSLGDICAMDFTKELLKISYNLVFEGRKYIQLPCAPVPGSLTLTMNPNPGIAHEIQGDKIVFAQILPPGTEVKAAGTCM